MQYITTKAILLPSSPKTERRANLVLHQTFYEGTNPQNKKLLVSEISISSIFKVVNIINRLDNFFALLTQNKTCFIKPFLL